MVDAGDALLSDLADLDCVAAVHVVSLSSGAQVGARADQAMVMASIFKPIVALEVFTQFETGDLNCADRVRRLAADRTPGPVGLSNFLHDAELSLRDLAYLMLTISDNDATDVLIERAGLNRVNDLLRRMECHATYIRSDLRTMLAEFAADMGFGSYAELLDAQAGRLGEAARGRSVDQSLIARTSALDPEHATRTTAQDMTRFLTATWRETATPPAASRALKQLMAQQVTRRLESAVPEGGTLAAKSGGLFGRVRNEIGVIGYPDGEEYAFAILTHAARPFHKAAANNAAMARTVDRAIAYLRD